MNRLFKIIFVLPNNYLLPITAVLALSLFASSSVLAQEQADSMLTAESTSHGDEDHEEGADHSDTESHAEGDEHQEGAGHSDAGGHGEEGEHEEEDQDTVELSAESIALAGIRTETLEPRAMPLELSAPGEVKFNAYSAAEVSTRVSAQIISRQARLGDHVQRGQPLVTLHSLEVADAQSALLLAAKEWERVQRLGTDLVGERRFIEARSGYEQARARLSVYDLSSAQIDKFTRGGGGTKLGRYTLTAPRDGTVLRDDFIVGDFVEPGTDLFLIADETVTWVETSLRPEQARRVRVGDTARIQSHSQWHNGKVTQKHHLIDESTRTISARIELTADSHAHDADGLDEQADHDEALHAGEFVDVRIAVGESTPRLSVPEAALQRDADGDWFVFVVEKAGHYRRVEVEPGVTLSDRRVITGLPVGTEVATEGAFYLASELAKSGFSIHNH